MNICSYKSCKASGNPEVLLQSLDNLENHKIFKVNQILNINSRCIWYCFKKFYSYLKLSRFKNKSIYYENKEKAMEWLSGNFFTLIKIWGIWLIFPGLSLVETITMEKGYISHQMLCPTFASYLFKQAWKNRISEPYFDSWV